MRDMRSLVLLLATLAACDSSRIADVRTSGDPFALRATWAAAATPIGASTVSATLDIQEHLGFRMNAALTITGTPNATYQWRIFRGSCAETAVAASNISATGLLLFATVQSYPNVVVGAGGTGASSPTIAGALDSLKSYSLRIRVSQTATNWNGTNPVACGNLQRTPA